MSNYTDWNPILKHIPETETKTILELGCGKGTKFLINNFQNVISFETAHNSKWYEISEKDYQNSPNWRGYFQPHSHYGFDVVDVTITASKGKKRSDTSALDKYWAELREQVNLDTIDVAFVDQGFHQRGETVTKFMEARIPYIFYHDTKAAAIYGYNKIELGDSYVKVKSLNGQGTQLIKRADI